MALSAVHQAFALNRTHQRKGKPSAQRHHDAIAVGLVGEDGVALSEHLTFPDPAKGIAERREGETLFHEAIGHRLAVIPEDPNGSIRAVTIAAGDRSVVEFAGFPAAGFCRPGQAQRQRKHNESPVVAEVPQGSWAHLLQYPQHRSDAQRVFPHRGRPVSDRPCVSAGGSVENPGKMVENLGELGKSRFVLPLRVLADQRCKANKKARTVGSWPQQR